MKISFEQLIKVAPFKEETRQKIMEQLSSLSDDQKYQLTTLAWKMIAALYQAKLKEKTDLILLEVAQGKKQYNKNDLVEVQVALYQELAKQFELVETEEGVKQVKEELEKYLKPMQGKEDPT